MTEGSEDVGMDLLTPTVSQPPLWEVGVRVGEDFRVSEVDAGVEIEMCSGGDVVPGQHEVLLTVPGYLRSVRPQSDCYNEYSISTN